MNPNEHTVPYGVKRRKPSMSSSGSAAVTAVLALLALTGCGASVPNLAVDVGGTESNVAASAATSASFTFTGETETFTVPAGVTSLTVDVAGAAGGGNHDADPHKDAWGQSGAGYEVSGSLSVTPGETLVIAVGGGGFLHDGSQRPGDGGWGYPDFSAGGTGGAGHSGGADGSGGGGASVIMRGNREVVVAGGGGGMGGPSTLTEGMLVPGQKGGDAGGKWGVDGNKAIGQTGGRGAATEVDYVNPRGGSATSGAAGGGGGGGGGYAQGEGGTKSYLGGGGGGGGNSYTAGLTDIRHSLNTKSRADGFVKLSWVVTDPSGVYAFQKTGTTDPQMLEDQARYTAEGSIVDTWEPVYEGDALQGNYRWSYEYQPEKGAGVLRNEDSGLCLEVNGADGKIDQWSCEPDSVNQLWKIVPTSDGNVALALVLDHDDVGQWNAGTYYLATTGDPDSVTNGSQLTLNPDITDIRSQWQSQQLG